MADKVSIAIRQEQAVRRFQSAMSIFSDRYGIEPAEIPLTGRDPDMLRALQWEALAEWAERVSEAESAEVQAQEATVTNNAAELEAQYRAKTKAELEAEAERRQIDLSGMKTKDEYIDAFLAAESAPAESE